MTCEGQYIHIHFFHVDGHDSGRLRRIDGEGDVVFAADASDLSYGLNGADYVGAVVDNHQLGIGTYGSGNVVGLHITLAIERQKRASTLASRTR